jgi:hypothetical protein
MFLRRTGPGLNPHRARRDGGGRERFFPGGPLAAESLANLLAVEQHADALTAALPDEPA